MGWRLARSIPMKKLEPLLRPHLVRNIVIFEDANGAIHFQNRQGSVANASYSMFAQRTVELVHGNVFLCHVRGNTFAIVDQKRRRSLEHFPEAAIQA